MTEQGKDEEAVLGWEDGSTTVDFIADTSIFEEDETTGEAVILGPPGPLVPYAASEQAHIGSVAPQLIYVDQETQDRVVPAAVPRKTGAQPGTMTPYEAFVFDLIDGSTPVGSIQRAGLLSQPEVTSVLYNLLDRGLIEIEPPAPVAEDDGERTAHRPNPFDALGGPDLAEAARLLLDTRAATRAFSALDAKLGSVPPPPADDEGSSSDLRWLPSVPAEQVSEAAPTDDPFAFNMNTEPSPLEAPASTPSAPPAPSPSPAVSVAPRPALGAAPRGPSLLPPPPMIAARLSTAPLPFVDAVAVAPAAGVTAPSAPSTPPVPAAPSTPPVASSPVASSPVASSPVASSPVASSPVASSPVGDLVPQVFDLVAPPPSAPPAPMALPPKAATLPLPAAAPVLPAPVLPAPTVAPVLPAPMAAPVLPAPTAAPVLPAPKSVTPASGTNALPEATAQRVAAPRRATLPPAEPPLPANSPPSPATSALRSSSNGIPAATTSPRSSSTGIPAATTSPRSSSTAIPAATTSPRSSSNGIPAATTSPRSSSNGIPAATTSPRSASAIAPPPPAPRASSAIAPPPPGEEPPKLSSELLSEIPAQRSPLLRTVSSTAHYKAKQLFEAALADRAKDDLVSARMNLKLAIAFDPANTKYQRVFLEIAEQAAPAKVPPKLASPQGQRAFDEGCSCELKGDVDAAIRHFESALKHGEDPVVLNRLGVLLAMKKSDFLRAQSLLERAIELSPDHAIYQHNLTKILTRAAGQSKNNKRGGKGSEPAKPAERRPSFFQRLFGRDGQ